MIYAGSNGGVSQIKQVKVQILCHGNLDDLVVFVMRKNTVAKMSVENLAAIVS